MTPKEMTAVLSKYSSHYYQAIFYQDNGNETLAKAHLAVCKAFTSMMGY